MKSGMAQLKCFVPISMRYYCSLSADSTYKKVKRPAGALLDKKYSRKFISSGKIKSRVVILQQFSHPCN